MCINCLLLFLYVALHYVMVSHIENPGHFYVQYIMECKSVHRLTQKINAFCSEESSLFTFSDEIKTGMYIFSLMVNVTPCSAKAFKSCNLNFETTKTVCVHRLFAFCLVEAGYVVSSKSDRAL